jgi:hypothetical protein
MKTKVEISTEAWNALATLAFEFLAQGGALRNVTAEAVEEALEALQTADIIGCKDD